MEAVESDDSAVAGVAVAAVAGVAAAVAAAVSVAALPSPSPALAASFERLGPCTSVRRCQLQDRQIMGKRTLFSLFCFRPFRRLSSNFRLRLLLQCVVACPRCDLYIPQPKRAFALLGQCIS